mgnify:CR=1 FL=1
MFEVGIGSTDANYMVLYENRLIKYYAKDPRELERLRNDVNAPKQGVVTQFPF